MNINSKNEHLRLSEYIESLQKKGSITFTKSQAMKDLGTTEYSFMRAAQRLQKKGILMRPVAGFYVIVKIEYRDSGGPPAIYFIHKLMAFLEQPYYLGLLSAATHYGATHQAVMETQIVTNHPIAMINYGRHRVRFITNKFTEKMPKQTLKTPHGNIFISSPEVTLFDLLRYPKKSAGLSHVATVVLEMSEKINGGKLSEVASIYDEAPLAQRVGYFIDTYGSSKIASPLKKWLKDKEMRFVKLDSGTSKEVGRNDKWSIVINSVIEPDEL